MSNPFDLGNLGNLLNTMTQRMASMQEEAASVEVEGRAGGNAVVVRATGNMEVRQVRIDPSALEDREMLEDLVTVAVNDALRRAREEMSRRAGDLTAGLPLPPGLL